MEERPHFEEKIPVHFHWHFMDSQTSFIIEIPEKMLSLRMIWKNWEKSTLYLPPTAKEE